MEPDQIVLYVNDIDTSRAFYSTLLGIDATQSSPNFTFFSLKNGWTLALFKNDAPGSDPSPVGGFELVFELPNREAVDKAAAEWKAQGVSFAMEPTELPFGYAFIGLDPDGTRLRVGYFPQG
jgi:catechol 2,3-dioxygenase-like lactoylglutathione lyase family enzyme